MTKKYVVEKNDFDAHVGNKSNPHGVTKAQVGLSNADNTADNVKSVASATKLTTARAINGVAFDGTKNISIDAVTAAQLQEVKNSVSDGKTKVANAITGKGISTATNATFTTMANNINAITTLGQGTSDANATAAQILSGNTAYVRGSKITGTIPSRGAVTITPGTSNQTITAGQYLSGNQTIAGSGNLKAENIKQGVNIFGVVGSVIAAASPNSRQWRYEEVTNIFPNIVRTDNGKTGSNLEFYYSGTGSITLPRQCIAVCIRSNWSYESARALIPGIGFVVDSSSGVVVIGSKLTYERDEATLTVSNDGLTLTLVANNWNFQNYRLMCLIVW